MAYSNSYLLIKNLILSKDNPKSIEVNVDHLKVLYYGDCVARRLELTEPLSDSELDDLLSILNSEKIECESDDTFPTEDDC
jgi:hypothetical protein